MKHQSHEETTSFVRYFVRPDFLGVLGGFVVAIVTVGIAWGTMSQKIDDVQMTKQANGKLIEDLSKTVSKDHDLIIAINQRLIYVQNFIERIPVATAAPEHGGGHLTKTENTPDENDR